MNTNRFALRIFLLICVCLRLGCSEVNAEESEVKKTPMLNGRIEELMSTQEPAFPFASPDANKLQEQTAVEDKHIQAYPNSISGVWKGTARIDENTYSALYDRALPKLVSREKALMYVGRAGTLQIAFTPESDGSIKDAQARIQFVPTVKDLPYVDMVLKPAPGAKPGQPPAIPPAMRFNVDFNSRGLGKGLTGKVGTQKEVTNSIVQLNPKTTEQTVGVQSQTEDANKVLKPSDWVESVIQLETVSPSKMLVHIASVKYSSTGVFLCKQIYHGEVEQTK